MPEPITVEQAIEMLPAEPIPIFRRIAGNDLHPTTKSRQWAADAIRHRGTTIVGVSQQTIGPCLELRDSGGIIFIKVKD